MTATPAPAADLRIFLLALALLLSACGAGAPAPVVNYGLSGGADSAGVHTVATGDTLWNIAQRYRVDMKDIVYVNSLRAPFFLEKGMRLTLPPPTTYRVREGDTLYSISRTFAASTTSLVQQNDLKAPYRLRPGQTLRLPSARPPPPAPQPAPVQIAAAPPAGSVFGSVKKAPLPDGKPSAPKTLPQTPPRASADGKFAWPVQGPVISSYGPKKDGLHNDGINIRAPEGAPVRAAENGVVVYADNRLSGFGNLILIRHEGRWTSAYAHLGKTFVRRGQQVRRGETVGAVGATGGVDSPQLHFELRRGAEALNPELYLGRQGS